MDLNDTNGLVNNNQVVLDVTKTKNTHKQVFGVDENEERGNWTGRFDFLLSLIGFAVGLGNVWRFPYLCYRNGGGAFLIPFAIMMVIVGMPLFYMEAAIGQFTSRGPMTCWGYAPLFSGIGYSMLVCTVLSAMYYNMILAWALYFVFASFTSELPWSSCYNSWNNILCSHRLPLLTCDGDNSTRSDNGTCYGADNTLMGIWDDEVFADYTGLKRESPAEQYWSGNVLKLSSGIDDFGEPIWYMVLCLMLAWTTVFLCLIKGIKSTGKVVYFTAIFPYVVLLILFFRGVTLDNAVEGIKFFIIPDFSRLSDARVWKDAAVQVFFSMSVAGGGLITLCSYNRFHNNILKDAIILCFADFLTCLFAGFVIFSYLGFMAGQQSTTIDKVAQSGAGLAFVVYPEAVTNLPFPQFWSVIFFCMLFSLGLDTQFTMVEAVLTACMDQIPALRPRKTLVVLVICIVFFLVGLPLTCPGGMYLLQIMDNYVGGWTLLILILVENIALAYVYGVQRFCKDLEVMLGFRQVIWFKICWYAVSPLTVAFIFMFTFIDYEPSTYGDYNFPVWADVMGWIFAIMIVLPMLFVFTFKLVQAGNFSSPFERIRHLSKPTPEWGPYLIKHRQLVDYVDDWVLDPYQKKISQIENGLLLQPVDS